MDVPDLNGKSIKPGIFSAQFFNDVIIGKVCEVANG
jgi:hypothetical protein